MMPRKNFGELNFSEGGVEDQYAASGDEQAQSAAGMAFNFGSVYVNTPVQVLGVSPGDNGMMPTRNMWYGSIGAQLAPIGLTAGQSYLFQDAANPVGWAGDTPVDLQPSATRKAPWVRESLNPVRVY